MADQKIDRKAILSRAKEIIEIYPSAGKDRVNKYLRDEFGVGLRSKVILDIKREVSEERPQQLWDLYSKGGVPKGYEDVYKGWRQAGFMPWEARELTVGHGERYRKFDAKAVYDSETGKQAREFRMKIIKEQTGMGWTKKQIIDNIMDFYRKGRKVSPWSHIRAEYVPRKKTDLLTYQDLRRVREKRKQKRLTRKMKKK